MLLVLLLERSTERSLIMDTLSHSVENEFNCSLCNKSMNSAQSLKHHMLTHIGAKIHKCTLCNYSSITVGALKSHTKIHTNEKQYRCSQCNKTFKIADHLKVHISHWQESRSRKISRRNDSIISLSLEKMEFSVLFLVLIFKMLRKKFSFSSRFMRFFEQFSFSSRFSRFLRKIFFCFLIYEITKKDSLSLLEFSRFCEKKSLSLLN